MKLVKGWWLPDSDTHFENYITDGGYQTIHRTSILNHIKNHNTERIKIFKKAHSIINNKSLM